MKFLVDTNIFGRNSEPNSPHYEAAKRAVEGLLNQRHELFSVPQVFYEYWVMATRPLDRNGLGLSPQETQAKIATLKQSFPLLPDDRSVFDHWEKLVVQRQVIGKPAHDARLVAAMLVHGLTHLLTFNVGDFKRYPEITAIDPASVTASSESGTAPSDL